MLDSTDAIIVGAGLAGLVSAERLTAEGKKVLIIEKKNHIGGHCYDYLNESGIYVHQYGPHIFHSDNEEVWQYLSRFTDWHYYHHTVLGMVDGQQVPIPFNLNSLEQLFSPDLFKKLEKKLIENYGFNSRVPIMRLRETEDPDLLFLAEYIYEKVFLNYTMKQWGQSKPEDLDPAVSGRVPVVISRDNRYFHNKHQGIPMNGYTTMFNRMIDNPNIRLMLNTDARDLVSIVENEIFFLKNKFEGEVIYAGPIDELLNFEFGELPYRSVDIQFKNYNQQYFQENSLVNYPNNYGFTRITEFKYFQKNCKELTSSTTICEEHPVSYKKGLNNPFYVINSNESAEVYNRYLNKVKKIRNLHMIGRLAEYKYYDMDQIVASALEKARFLCKDSETIFSS
jgi:UDP-galactopyranose mutase